MIVNPAIYGKKTSEKIVETATPSISVTESGLVVAETNQESGVVEGGVKRSTMQLPTRGGANVTPSESEQVAAEKGEFLTGDVIVDPIPSEYIVPAGAKQITLNGTHDVREYASVEVNVESDVELPPAVPQAVPQISVSSGGLITAKTTQEGGIVDGGTKTKTLQLPVNQGGSVTPTESPQTVATAGQYVVSDIVVEGAQLGLDTSDATATDDTVFAGETYYGKNGKSTGKFTIDTELAEQDDLITALEELAENIPGGGTGGIYSLDVSFYALGSSGEETPGDYFGYYQINGGTASFFDGASSLSIVNALNATSVVKIFLSESASYGYDAENCYIEYSTVIEEVDGMETVFYVFTLTNFTDDATASISET